MGSEIVGQHQYHFYVKLTTLRGSVENDSGELLFHLRKDPLSTVEETEILDATDTLIASCERVYRTRDAYITVNDKGRNICKYKMVHRNSVNVSVSLLQFS